MNELRGLLKDIDICTDKLQEIREYIEDNHLKWDLKLEKIVKTKILFRVITPNQNWGYRAEYLFRKGHYNIHYHLDEYQNIDTSVNFMDKLQTLEAQK